MILNSRRIFLDTSVIFAAVLSETGGARKLFQLGEAGLLQLIVGPNVLRECEEIARRKVPASLPRLAYLLELSLVEIAGKLSDGHLEQASTIVVYRPDAYVLAEAMGAQPDWFVTHDKAHFLNIDPAPHLAFRIGTSGDLIQALEDELTGR